MMSLSVRSSSTYRNSDPSGLTVSPRPPLDGAAKSSQWPGAHTSQVQELHHRIERPLHEVDAALGQSPIAEKLLPLGSFQQGGIATAHAPAPDSVASNMPYFANCTGARHRTVLSRSPGGSPSATRDCRRALRYSNADPISTPPAPTFAARNELDFNRVLGSEPNCHRVRWGVAQPLTWRRFDRRPRPTAPPAPGAPPAFASSSADDVPTRFVFPALLRTIPD